MVGRKRRDLDRLSIDPREFAEYGDIYHPAFGPWEPTPEQEAAFERRRAEREGGARQE